MVTSCRQGHLVLTDFMAIPVSDYNKAFKALFLDEVGDLVTI